MITAGVGPAMVALVVLGWWAGLERMAVMVLIAVRSGLSCRRGRLVLALPGLRLLETADLFFSFFFLIFISCMYICIYVYMYIINSCK